MFSIGPLYVDLVEFNSSTGLFLNVLQMFAHGMNEGMSVAHRGGAGG